MDILTGAKGLAGVLYVPLLVAVASAARRQEVLAFGLLGILFSIVAFFVARTRAPHVVAAWPLGVGLAAVVIASLLLSRLVGSRDQLQETNRKLAYSEWRYRSLFSQSRFPFWEQDYNAAFALYQTLRDDGVVSLLEHARRDPSLAGNIAASIKALDWNDAMMALVGAESPAEFPKSLAEMGIDPIKLLVNQQKLFDGERHLAGRAVLTTLRGERKDIWVAGEISSDPERPGTLVGFIVDLSESERARRTLAAAQSELARASRVATVGALSASIAHELNQPLAATMMNAQTCLRYLNRPIPDTASAIAAAERAVSQANRASEIVRRTRDLVASRTSREDLVDLTSMIQDVLGLIDADVREAEIEVDFVHPRQTVELIADRVALQQVLVNLFGNAVQAMREAQSTRRRLLSIDLEHSGNDAVVRVHDTGPGIAEAILERLFEPFFTTKDGGIGVGLAISRSAVEARGGTLEAFNSRDGGAIFECRIPIDRESV